MVKTYPVPCTQEEMKRLLDAAMEDDFYYMFFKVAVKTGRRLGEYYGEPEQVTSGVEDYIDSMGNHRVRKKKVKTGKYNDGVKVKDIDFEKRIMMTKVLKRRKRIEKEAILDDELVGLLKRHIQREKLMLEDFVFRKVSYRQIQNRVVYYAKKAGITHPVTFHNFRHYFITELVKKGWSYDKITKLTGHSTIGTIAAYDHSVASDIAKEAREAMKGI